MKYKCDLCGGEFESTWSDDEALAEFKRRFPNEPPPSSVPASTVCEVCYEILRRYYGN